MDLKRDRILGWPKAIQRWCLARDFGMSLRRRNPVHTNTMLTLTLIGLTTACTTENLQNTFFVSKQIVSRDDLMSISHSGDFILWYNREHKVVYGVIENSELGDISAASMRPADLREMKNLSEFWANVDDGSPFRLCTKSYAVDSKTERDAFFFNFNEVVDDFRRRGYPLAGATYVGSVDCYEIQLTYFAECDYLDGDARDFVQRLSSPR